MMDCYDGHNIRLSVWQRCWLQWNARDWIKPFSLICVKTRHRWLRSYYEDRRITLEESETFCIHKCVSAGRSVSLLSVAVCVCVSVHSKKLHQLQLQLFSWMQDQENTVFSLIVFSSCRKTASLVSLHRHSEYSEFSTQSDKISYIKEEKKLDTWLFRLITNWLIW